MADPATAIESMKKAVELAPDNVLYQETLGVYLVESKRYGEATAALAGVAGGHHPHATRDRLNRRVVRH